MKGRTKSCSERSIHCDSMQARELKELLIQIVKFDCLKCVYVCMIKLVRSFDSIRPTEDWMVNVKQIWPTYRLVAVRSCKCANTQSPEFGDRKGI